MTPEETYKHHLSAGSHASAIEAVFSAGVALATV